MKTPTKFRIKFTAATLLLIQGINSVFAAWIDSVDHWAWASRSSWINFNGTSTNVDVTDNAITGFAWGDTVGWLNFQTSVVGVTNTCAWNLSGYAWSNTIGWIDFAGVAIDGNGYFQGTAFDETSSPVKFRGTNYRLRTDWRPSCAGSPAIAVTAPTSGSATTDNTPTISWTSSTPGATIIITGAAGQTCTTTVAVDGTYSCTISPSLTQGTQVLSVTQVLASGIADDPVNITLSVDTTAPSATVAPDMTDATDTGASATDNLTGNATPNFQGVCSNGDTITLYVDGVSAGSSVCSWGSYSITPSPALADGVHDITTSATDPAGNAGPQGSALSVTVNTSAPGAPGTPDMTSPTDTGTSNSDNLTSDGTPDFTGTCTTGDTVTLLINGTAAANTVCTGGAYTLTPSPALPDGTYTATTTATDPAGNTSSPSTGLVFTVDAATPGAPATAPDLASGSDTGISSADDMTSDTTPDFTGPCNGGDTITLLIGGTPAGVTNCTGSGATTWSITVSPALADGTYTATATTTDGAGNISNPSLDLPFTIDTSAPSALAIPDMTLPSDTGNSATDDLTNVTAPSFVGSCTNGDTIAMFIDGAPIETTVCAGGVYAFTAPTALLDGTHSVTVTATDRAWNTGPQSPALTITIDTLAPTAPAAPDMTAATDTGSSNTDNITSNTTPDFTGLCTDGDTITLFIDGQAAATTVCAGGTYSLTPASALTGGTHAISTSATDPAGNASALLPALTVTIVTASGTAGAPDMTAATDSGVSNSDNTTIDTTPDFTGNCTTGETMTLHVNGSAAGSTVCTQGHYTLTPSPALDQGGQTITVTSTNAGGLTSSPSAPLPVIIDSVAPATPMLTSPTNGNPVTGTAEPGSTVTITTPSGATCTVTANASSRYNCVLAPTPVNGESVTVTATDASGNSSSVTEPNAISLPTGGGSSDGGGNGAPTTATTIDHVVHTTITAPTIETHQTTPPRERAVEQKAHEQTLELDAARPEPTDEDIRTLVQMELKKKYATCPVIDHIVDPTYNASYTLQFPDAYGFDHVVAINDLGRAGILDGYTDRQLHPGWSITRAEFLKMVLLAHCYQYKDQDPTDLWFADLVPATWQAKVVKKAILLGLVDGDQDRHSPPVFRADDPITRSEAIKILINMAEVRFGKTWRPSYMDLGTSWSWNYVAKAEKLGLIDPESERFMFLGDGSSRRADAIDMLVRLVHLYR
jgi:hypothetical protein